MQEAVLNHSCARRCAVVRFIYEPSISGVEHLLQSWTELHGIVQNWLRPWFRQDGRAVYFVRHNRLCH